VGVLWFSGGEYLGDGTRRNWRWLLNMPRGWVQQNKVVACEFITPAIDAVAARGTAEFAALRTKMLDCERHFGGGTTTPYDFLAQMVTPAFQKVSGQAISVTSRVRLAQVACALERHRLARGSHPETLAQLVPEFLPSVPRDLIDGQSLRYHRVPEGGFDLYSIGFDGKDDGGAPVEPEAQDATASGDWCWPRAVSAAP
jgi:hypothetical protein